MLMVMMIACSDPSNPGGTTIDLVDGTYIGYPADGDPADGVRVRNEDSTLAVRFYEQDSDLWAFVSFRGRMVVDGLVLKEEDSTIEGVTVDGTDLWCTVAFVGFRFGVTGKFSDDLGSLYLDISNVGSMTLDRQGGADPPVDDPGAV